MRWSAGVWPFVLPAVLATGLSQAKAAPSQREANEDFRRIFAVPQSRLSELTHSPTMAALSSNMEKAKRELGVHATNPLTYLHLWHAIALDSTSVDYVPSKDSSGHPTGFEQNGPPRTSHAMALFHLTLFEIANAYAKGPFESWLSSSNGGGPALAGIALTAPADPASESAALIEGAAYALARLYPEQAAGFKTAEANSFTLLASNDLKAIAAGKAFGVLVAATVMAVRDNDGSNLADPIWGVNFPPANSPILSNPETHWAVDPVSNNKTALGGNWADVPLFVASTVDLANLLPVPPAAPTKPADLKPGSPMLKNYQEVLTQGSDIYHTRRQDTKGFAHYLTAKFWAYDTSPGLCAPTRMYAQIADRLLSQHGDAVAPHADGPSADPVLGAAEVARYEALVALTLADAATVAWQEKYHFVYPRPITTIRIVAETQPASPPGFTGSTAWFPLGAQTTNTSNAFAVTPPFPSYPSGHAVFGGALFAALGKLFPTQSDFAFASDEFNPDVIYDDLLKSVLGAGYQTKLHNVDPYNFVRCEEGDLFASVCQQKRGKLVHFSLKEADDANAMSRVWMGVHWHFDAVCGQDLGHAVGLWVVGHALEPVANSKSTLQAVGPFANPKKGDLAGCATKPFDSTILPASDAVWLDKKNVAEIITPH